MVGSGGGKERLKPPVFGVQKVGKGLIKMPCWHVGPCGENGLGMTQVVVILSSGGLMSEAAFLCVFVQKMVEIYV